MTDNATQDTPTTRGSSVPPPGGTAHHVVFLDGMRGAAALYVTLFHLATILPRPELAEWARIATLPFTQGHIGVGVFIVLSGYLLMLPPARSDGFELRGGLKTFFSRRSRRILPPYYAALFLSVPTELYRQHLHGEHFSLSAFLSHLFLVHNLRSDWSGAINGPLWSVATEFQIYLVFALLLLPLCRKLHVGAAVVCAWILGLLPLFLLSHDQSFWWARPWYLGLFALGMLGATITQRGETLPWTRAANRLPWMIFALVCFVASLIPIGGGFVGFVAHDMLIGFAALGLIIAGVRALQPGAKKDGGQFVASVFGSRAMVGLGAFSYSLYLIHFPLLNTLDTLFKHVSASPMALAVFQFAVVLPIVLVAGYVFYRIFEKPFTVPRKAAREPFVPALTPQADKIT